MPGGDQNQRSEPQSGVRDAVIDEPGLRRAVGLFLQSRPGKAADIEAETLAAFLPPWSAASRAERAGRPHLLGPALQPWIPRRRRRRRGQDLRFFLGGPSSVPAVSHWLAQLRSRPRSHQPREPYLTHSLGSPIRPGRGRLPRSR